MQALGRLYGIDFVPKTLESERVALLETHITTEKISYSVIKSVMEGQEWKRFSYNSGYEKKAPCPKQQYLILDEYKICLERFKTP